MGQLGKQSVYGFLSSYAGMILGIANKLFFFPLVFKDNNEYWGLIELFVNISIIIGSVGHLGMPFVLRRFLPAINEHKNKLIGFTLILSTIGCLLVTLAMWMGQDNVIAFNAGKNDEALIRQYYPYLLVLVAIMLYIDYLGAVMTSYYKAHLPLFLNNVVFRVGVLLLIGAYYWLGFSLHIFIIAYFSIYLFLLAFSLFYLIKKNLLAIRLTTMLPERTAYTQFGLFSVLSGSSAFIVNYMDAIFVSKYLSLALVPVFVLSKNIVNVMHVPARAVVSASIPLVSKAWKDRDIAQLESIYKKTAIAEFLVGGLIFLAIWINIDWILQLLPGQDWSQAKWVILVLGLGLLADLSAGANMAITSNSPHYKYFLLANIVVMFFGIGLNMWLTPSLGLVGAALALSLGITLNNTIMVLLLWWKEKIQPYTRQHAILFVWFAVMSFTFQFDLCANTWMNVAVKNVLYAGIAFYIIWFLKPLPEINSFIAYSWNRIKSFKKQ